MPSERTVNCWRSDPEHVSTTRFVVVVLYVMHCPDDCRMNAPGVWLATFPVKFHPNETVGDEVLQGKRVSCGPCAARATVATESANAAEVRPGRILGVEVRTWASLLFNSAQNGRRTLKDTRHPGSTSRKRPGADSRPPRPFGNGCSAEDNRGWVECVCPPCFLPVFTPTAPGPDRPAAHFVTVANAVQMLREQGINPTVGDVADQLERFASFDGRISLVDVLEREPGGVLAKALTGSLAVPDFKSFTRTWRGSGRDHLGLGVLGS